MWEVKVSKVFGSGLLMEDNDIVSAFWIESDGWRGWDFNEEMNRYFFNDIPSDGFGATWSVLEDMQGVINLD